MSIHFPTQASKLGSYFSHMRYTLTHPGKWAGWMLILFLIMGTLLPLRQTNTANICLLLDKHFQTQWMVTWDGVRLQKPSHVYCISSIRRCSYYFFHCTFGVATIVYFFGKPTDINDSWIRYIWAMQWWLLDAVSSKHSLSVLLSAVETSHTTHTALALFTCTCASAA